MFYLLSSDAIERRVCMNRKLLIFSLLAGAGLMVFALSAVTAYALVGTGAIGAEAVTVDDVLQVAPVQAEVAPAIAPVIEYERASYFEGGGCSHSQMMMTQAEEKTLEEQPLAQAGQ
jgi:hypothetical protein